MVIDATIAKVNASNNEPGVVRFDAFQTSETTIVIQEVYCDRRAMAAHKQTAHYSHWRAVVDHTAAAYRTKHIVTECDDRLSLTR
jgi:quinol monooxygenase YgiN